MTSRKNVGNTLGLERKIIEKNRRIHMKNLCLDLLSLIPIQTNTRVSSPSPNDQLDVAIAYIKEQSDRIQSLKTKKHLNLRLNSGHHNKNNGINDAAKTCKISVVIDEKDSGSVSEVILTSRINNNVKMSGITGILEEEGAAVMSASFFSASDGTDLFTIHSQVKNSRIGVELARIHQRLNELLVHSTTYAFSTCSATCWK